MVERDPDTPDQLVVYYLIHVDLRVRDIPPARRYALLEKQALVLGHIRELLEERERQDSRSGPYSDLGDSSSFGLNIPVEGTLDRELEPGGSSQLGKYSGICSSGNPDPTGEFQDSSPSDLFFWSLDPDDGVADEDDKISDYVTMANSATSSLFREYINVLEGARFSSVCPEKLSWRVVEKYNEILTLEKVGTNIVCMAGVANIRAKPTDLLNFLKDHRSRFIYDSTLHKTRVISEINANLRVIHAHHKAKHCFIGHGRDFLFLQYHRTEGSKELLAHTSCTHHSCPEDPEITRGTMYETGFVIEPLPAEEALSSVVYLVKIDLGASVPESLLKLIKKRQPRILIEIKKYFER